MKKYRLTITEHGTYERWGSWIVSLPDNADIGNVTQCIEVDAENGEWELREIEEATDSYSVDLEPYDGLQDVLGVLDDEGQAIEEEQLKAFTDEQLETEMKRRKDVVK